MLARITDKILPVVKEWQQRPLESVYAVVFMDAIHYHVRCEGRIVKKAVYIAIGIDMDGKKDVLGMYVGENESAKYWLQILNGLKNRGVEDMMKLSITLDTLTARIMKLSSDSQRRIEPTPFYSRWDTTDRRADSAVAPVAHEISPYHRF